MSHRRTYPFSRFSPQKPVRKAVCRVCEKETTVDWKGRIKKHMSPPPAFKYCAGWGQPPKARSPKPGEDWSKAAKCRNVRRWHGPCCFCDEPIKPHQGYMASLGVERAHYDCAPGLGVAPTPAGAQ